VISAVLLTLLPEPKGDSLDECIDPLPRVYGRLEIYLFFIYCLNNLFNCSLNDLSIFLKIIETSKSYFKNI